MRQIRETLTPREQQQYENDKEIMRMQMDHQKEIRAMELQVERLSASFASWLKIPLFILSLPVKILLVIPVAIYAVRGKEVPEQLWKLL